MHSFDHITPTTLSEALELLGRNNGTAKVIAGGTDLILQLRNGLQSPDLLVNIKRLEELRGIRYSEDSGLEIGALTTLREIHRSEIVLRHYRCLSDAASRMASEQIRAFATIGGNLCNGSPSADQAAPLLALDASLHLVSREGSRIVPLENFFIGPGLTDLKAGEILQMISVPKPSGKAVFIKHIPRAFMDISVVCVAIRLVLEGNQCLTARVVLGAVAPTPIRAHEAEGILAGSIEPDKIARAAKLAAEASKPIDDAKGSAWYRKRMVETLVARGLASLVE